MASKGYTVDRTPLRDLLGAPFGNASDALGTLSASTAITGITRGQFSMLDLIFAALDQVGPAHVIVSTWTMGVKDAENAARLLDDGRISTLRFLVDRSFMTRQAEYARLMEQRFGKESFVLSRIHAKWAVIWTESGRWLTIRGSMNLNRNAQWEQFDVDADPRVGAFFVNLARELGGFIAPGLFASERATDSAWTEAANWTATGADRVVGGTMEAGAPVAGAVHAAGLPGADLPSSFVPVLDKRASLREKALHAELLVLDHRLSAAARDRGHTAVMAGGGQRLKLLESLMSATAARIAEEERKRGGSDVEETIAAAFARLPKAMQGRLLKRWSA